jgi:hypothetical protein
MLYNPCKILLGNDLKNNALGYIAVDTEQKRFYTKSSVKSAHWNSIFDNRDLRGVVTKNFNIM